MAVFRLHPLFSTRDLTRLYYFMGPFILPVKFTQNRQNKQRHFYSNGKIARRLSKSIVGWNIHMARSRNRKILCGLCAQREGVSVVQVMQ